MKLAVLGSPVAHSLSPVMHRAALDAAGIDGSYEAIDVDAAGFVTQIEALRSGLLDGANVTMPHKARAHDLCDTLSGVAHRAGAVNTLFRNGGELVGENTDVSGIRSAWERARLPVGVPVVVIGSGGAAAAALVALEGQRLSVTARRRSASAALIERTGVEASVVPWGEKLPSGVLVNATPIGMRGEELPDFLLNSATGLFDMAYGDEPTPAVAMSTRLGLPVAAGLDMLVGQAIASFARWTGYEVDHSVMRVAAERELSRRKEAAE